MSPDLCQKRVRPIAYSCDHVLRSQVTPVSRNRRNIHTCNTE